MAHVCATYDPVHKTVHSMTFVVLVKEEAQRGYEPGHIITIKNKQYILVNRRFVAAGSVVQYDMEIKKG